MELSGVLSMTLQRVRSRNSMVMLVALLACVAILMQGQPAQAQTTPPPPPTPLSPAATTLLKQLSVWSTDFQRTPTFKRMVAFGTLHGPRTPPTPQSTTSTVTIPASDPTLSLAESISQLLEPDQTLVRAWHAATPDVAPATIAGLKQIFSDPVYVDAIHSLQEMMADPAFAELGAPLGVQAPAGLFAAPHLTTARFSATPQLTTAGPAVASPTLPNSCNTDTQCDPLLISVPDYGFVLSDSTAAVVEFASIRARDVAYYATLITIFVGFIAGVAGCGNIRLGFLIAACVLGAETIFLGSLTALEATYPEISNRQLAAFIELGYRVRNNLLRFAAQGQTALVRYLADILRRLGTEVRRCILVPSICPHT